METICGERPGVGGQPTPLWGLVGISPVRIGLTDQTPHQNRVAEPLSRTERTGRTTIRRTIWTAARWTRGVEAAIKTLDRCLDLRRHWGGCSHSDPERKHESRQRQKPLASHRAYLRRKKKALRQAVDSNRHSIQAEAHRLGVVRAYPEMQDAPTVEKW